MTASDGQTPADRPREARGTAPDPVREPYRGPLSPRARAVTHAKDDAQRAYVMRTTRAER